MANKKETCPTCGSITSEYVYNFDYLTAKLLLAMGRSVKGAMGNGKPFTIANKVHMPTLPGVPYNVISRNTITAKLGLIAKFMKDGHQERGMWVVTARGWAALRGEPVPAKVSVYRNQITERHDEFITVQGALKTFPDSTYNPQEWYEFGKNQLL